MFSRLQEILMRNQRTIVVVLVAIFNIFFNLNQESFAATPPPVFVDAIGSCSHSSDLKDGLKCCEGAEGRVTACRRLVRAHFADKARETAASKANRAYEPGDVEKCLVESDEKGAVACCTFIKNVSRQATCLERVMAEVETGGTITPSSDDDFRASSRKRSLEELASRRRLMYAAGQVARLKVEITGLKDDVFGRLSKVTEMLEMLPEELRKEFREQLIQAVTESEAKCAKLIGDIQTSISKRIDDIEKRVTENSAKIVDHESRITALESRSSIGLQVGGWGAFDKVGAIGGVRADVLLKWEKSHFQLGGGLGGSPSGLAWMAEVSGFYHVSPSFFIGGGVLAAADASDLAETDHVLMGISPSVQFLLGKSFVIEASAVLGAIVRPGGEWTPSAGGFLISGSFHF